MKLSQKCQYAVRAVLELSKRYGMGPVTIGEIAKKQAAPPRFLEIILNEMRQGGLVRSRRGVQGGYELGMDPKDIVVGQVIRLVDGPLDPVSCPSGPERAKCPLVDGCALVGLWKRAKEAVEAVYDGTSFRDLVEQEKELQEQVPADFII